MNRHTYPQHEYVWWFLIHMYYMMELTHKCGWIGHLPDKTRMRMCPVLLAVRAREISRLLLLEKVQKQIETNITGWWYTYPSEKWWSSSVGMIIPNIWKSKQYSKPPTRKTLLRKALKLWNHPPHPSKSVKHEFDQAAGHPDFLNQFIWDCIWRNFQTVHLVHLNISKLYAFI